MGGGGGLSAMAMDDKDRQPVSGGEGQAGTGSGRRAQYGGECVCGGGALEPLPSFLPSFLRRSRPMSRLIFTFFLVTSFFFLLQTLRVSNISEDTKEADLQELFEPFGSIYRIYLAKDKETMQSRYVTRSFSQPASQTFITHITASAANKRAERGHSLSEVVHTHKKFVPVSSSNSPIFLKIIQ